MLLGGYCEDGHEKQQSKERGCRGRKNHRKKEREGGKEGRKEGRKRKGMNGERERSLETVYRHVRKYNLSQCFPVSVATIRFSYLKFKVA